MALCLLPRHRRHFACLIKTELVAPTAFVLNFMLISDINWGRPQSQYLILGKQMVIYPNQWKRAIHTKDDKGNLKNWQPISLLNVDYKICSKAISLRLAKVLGSIVDADQTCSVSGRSMFSYLVFLRDTLAFIERTNETGILVSLDQEKASNPVDRSFLLNILELFGFGVWFRTRIATVYKGFVYAGLGWWFFIRSHTAWALASLV